MNRPFSKDTAVSRRYRHVFFDICDIQSMQGMASEFNDESCAENLCRVLEVECHEFLPHYVTVKDFLKKLETEELGLERFLMYFAAGKE